MPYGLASGLALFGRSQGQEVVVHEQMEVALLASEGNLELIRHVLTPGGRWGLYPDAASTGFEAVLVVSGQLEWSGWGDSPGVLESGDCLTCAPLRSEIAFRALTRVELVYVCSQPVFHGYSRQCRDMIDLAIAVETKDGYTIYHCRQLVDLCMAIAAPLGLLPQQIARLNHGALLHDLGKVQVPDAILGKSGPLSDEEWEIMKLHTVWGQDMVQGTYLEPAGQILRQHHERWNGSGYPDGLAGDAICLEAQIVGVADSYSAMTTDRVYRPRMSPQEALAELHSKRGILYRADIVDVFIQVHGQTELR